MPLPLLLNGTRDAAAARPEVVSVEHLSKRFGSLLAVDDLTFALEPGTVTGFLGPNGAGKTTTLRMLLGLVRANLRHRARVRRRYRELWSPRGGSERCWRRPISIPAARAESTSRRWRSRRGCRVARVDEVLELVELVAAGATPRRARTRSGCASGSGSRPRCSAIRSS